MNKVCVVAGVGPGNGASISNRFAAEGYMTVMLARNEDYLAALSTTIDNFFETFQYQLYWRSVAERFLCWPRLRVQVASRQWYYFPYCLDFAFWNSDF